MNNAVKSEKVFTLSSSRYIIAKKKKTEGKAAS